MYIANIKNWNNHGFQVTSQAAKVARAMINHVNRISPMENPWIPNLQWKSKRII